jgi:hypothetical protein
MEINGKQYQQFMQFEPQNINPADPDENYYIQLSVPFLSG